MDGGPGGVAMPVKYDIHRVVKDVVKGSILPGQIVHETDFEAIKAQHVLGLNTLVGEERVMVTVPFGCQHRCDGLEPVKDGPDINISRVENHVYSTKDFSHLWWHISARTGDMSIRN